MSLHESEVYIVDADDNFRSRAQALLSSADVRVVTYASGERFLREFVHSNSACVLLDLHLNDLDALTIQERLRNTSDWIPVIFTTNSADVSTVASVMRAGAWHVLQKPIDGPNLLGHVQEALNLARQTREVMASQSTLAARLALLSKREREILHSLLEGHSSREVAEMLGTSPYTVEKQRANIMRKMQARTVAELALMYSAVDPDHKVPRAPAIFWWAANKSQQAQME